MFFDRPETGELAVLVHLDIASAEHSEDPREFEELVLSAGGDPVDFITGTRDTPKAKLFVGIGKLDEIRMSLEIHEAEMVIFNHTLTPSQERNLEEELQCRVLDRTGLILDIFAQRARSHEGKLQVELAQLQYMSTRLVRGWTHLERQKGGIGLRGPGETQLETDRRLLQVRLNTIKSRLEKVQSQHEQGRRARQRAEIATVSLVGYTNAGKSTLFNRLTGSDVYAADQLFATLDPTMRRVHLPEYGPAIMADTVGFISHLPHKLVDAFRATLEEAASADLLLHVVDCATEDRPVHIEHVKEVLVEIKASEIPTLLVYNKIDLLEYTEPRIDRDENGVPIIVWISAKDGGGFELLQQAVVERLAGGLVHGTFRIEPRYSRLMAKLHEQGAVLSESYNDLGDSLLEIRLPKSDWQRLLRLEDLDEESLKPTN